MHLMFHLADLPATRPKLDYRHCFNWQNGASHVEKGTSKEDHHAHISHSKCPPPRRGRPTTQHPINRLWHALPVDARRKTLQALSRVVAQQLGEPPNPLEVSHDPS
jgi:hypothetical protein